MEKTTIETEYGKVNLDFDPAKYKSVAGAAKAFYKPLCKLAGDIGQSADEIMLMNPERTRQYSGYKQWCVVWESGPYEWACTASFEVQGPWGHTEPYYSFDLHFYQ